MSSPIPSPSKSQDNSIKSSLNSLPPVHLSEPDLNNGQSKSLESDGTPLLTPKPFVDNSPSLSDATFFRKTASVDILSLSPIAGSPAITPRRIQYVVSDTDNQSYRPSNNILNPSPLISPRVISSSPPQTAVFVSSSPNLPKTQDFVNGTNILESSLSHRSSIDEYSTEDPPSSLSHSSEIAFKLATPNEIESTLNPDHCSSVSDATNSVNPTSDETDDDDYNTNENNENDEPNSDNNSNDPLNATPNIVVATQTTSNNHNDSIKTEPIQDDHPSPAVLTKQTQSPSLERAVTAHLPTSPIFESGLKDTLTYSTLTDCADEPILRDLPFTPHTLTTPPNGNTKPTHTHPINPPPSMNNLNQQNSLLPPVHQTIININIAQNTGPYPTNIVININPSPLTPTQNYNTSTTNPTSQIVINISTANPQTNM